MKSLPDLDDWDDASFSSNTLKIHLDNKKWFYYM